jgi:thiamine kinase-like enzyme
VHGLSQPPPWALAQVPGIGPDLRAQRIERLSGGSVNEVYRIDTAAGRYVLRLDGPEWRRPGVSRNREALLYRTAAEAGLAPPLLVVDVQRQGLLISEFVDGQPWDAARYQDRSSLQRLGETLFRLHRLQPPPIHAFDPWQVAQDYLGRIPGGAAALPAGPLSRLHAVCAGLAAEPAVSIVHGDLAQGNLLEGSRLWLLDWEYAQRSEALMDLACVLAYYPAAHPYRRDLAAAAGLPQAGLDGALSERVQIYRGLTWLWHLARGEAAAPP